MNASKENCQRALDHLRTQEQFMNEYAFKTIEAFLEAAYKRLPREESFPKKKVAPPEEPNPYI